MANELALPRQNAPILTPELAETLIQGAATGMFLHGVAEACGVDPEVLEQWLQMGLSSNAVEPYRTFALRYRSQERVPQMTALASVQSALGDPNLALKFLALRYPEEFGPKASRTKQAGDLKPQGDDELTEEIMVEQLLLTRPPVVERIFKKLGIQWPDEPTQSSSDPSAEPPPGASSR
jgi:hypothetical protein